MTVKRLKTTTLEAKSHAQQLIICGQNWYKHPPVERFEQNEEITNKDRPVH